MSSKTLTETESALLALLPAVFARYEDPKKNLAPTEIRAESGGLIFTASYRSFQALWAKGALVEMERLGAGSSLFMKAE